MLNVSFLVLNVRWSSIKRNLSHRNHGLPIELAYSLNNWHLVRIHPRSLWLRHQPSPILVAWWRPADFAVYHLLIIIIRDASLIIKMISTNTLARGIRGVNVFVLAVVAVLLYQQGVSGQTPKPPATPSSNTTNATVSPVPQVAPARVNGCLIGNNSYCLNSGRCGINGNCICARLYLGEQCELRVK